MTPDTNSQALLADAVRAACVEAACLAYEDAGIRGLCAEGRWEAALAAIRHLDLSSVLDAAGAAGIIRSTPESHGPPIAPRPASRT